MTVFDFDKTLTNRDTLFGFYREVDGRHPLFRLKQLLLLLAAVCYKLNMIDNDRLKAIGIKLFLAGKPRETIESAAAGYARKIKLNDIYYREYQSTAEADRLIISASLESYLRELFPGEQIAASRLKYRSGKVLGLELNMYGPEKRAFLHHQGISRIDCLFTDSPADQPLMDMAGQVFMVRNGKITNTVHAG